MECPMQCISETISELSVAELLKPKHGMGYRIVTLESGKQEIFLLDDLASSLVSSGDEIVDSR